MNNLNAARQLLCQISQGDKRSFNRLFRLYYEKFIKISLHYVRGYNNAEDIVSDVFVKILNKAGQLKDIDRIEAYLFRMVKYQCLDFLKKKGNQSLILVDEFEGNYFEGTGDLRIDIDGKELESIISQCIDQFPPKRKIVYKLVKEDLLKYKEVAEILNISPRTVENHLCLALKHLREVIEMYYLDVQVQIPVRSIGILTGN